MLEIIMKSLIWIFLILFAIYVVYKSIKMYQQAESYAEKVLDILFSVVWIIPWVILFLDKKNIPTWLGYAKGVDTGRWFEFISVYVTGVVGSVISGIVLWLITLRQFKNQRDSDSETKRIQNAPIFDYEVSSWLADSERDGMRVITKNKVGERQYIYFKIENIGLNHAKDVEFIINYGNDSTMQFALDYHQSFLQKEEKRWEQLLFNDDDKNEKEINIEIHYSDLINNSYNQKVRIVFEPTNSKTVKIKDFTVEPAALVKKDGKKC